MPTDEVPTLTAEEREEARKLRENVGPEWQGAFARARARRAIGFMTPDQTAIYQREMESLPTRKGT
jgi:hypothetical protein